MAVATAGAVAFLIVRVISKIVNSTISGNVAKGGEGFYYGYYTDGGDGGGGGIFNSGDLKIINSTISGNRAEGGGGD